MDNLIRQFSEEIDEASETLGSGVYNKLSDLSKEMHDLERDKLVEITYMVFMPVQKKTMNGNIKIVIMKTIKKAYYPFSQITKTNGNPIHTSLRHLNPNIRLHGTSLTINCHTETKLFCLPDSGNNNCDDNGCDCSDLELICPESILLDMKFVN